MFLVDFLGAIMRICYQVFNNYGLAILLFTLISKVVLLPLSIWVQKNSIKMVKMQPSINQIKIDYFGDKDRIADEQSKLFKKEKYNAFISLVPLTIQIVLLLCLVAVINKPLTHILHTPKDVIEEMVEVTVDQNNLNSESSSLELEVVNDIKNGQHLEEYQKIENISKAISDIKALDMNFLGFNLGWIARVELGMAILVPILAGLSALILSLAQNRMNVLQASQSNVNKYGTLLFSVGLSLYLGTFVPAGVALYWIFSNLFAIVQQWLLNMAISPKKYIDYEALNRTNTTLKELNDINKKNRMTKAMKAKAKADYKRFFKVINKHLVFYSENNGFYKYFRGIIDYILENTNITIHYITSDYNDHIFELEKKNSQIKAYYIDDKRLITLMMKMDADVVVMTMPDLENYHIKRSYLRKDIEYVFVQHSMCSLNLTYRNKALNAFDTIFVTGPYQYDELKEIFALYQLENRKLIKQGYSLLDDMIEEYKKNKKVNKVKKILIAPSWQKDNIIDLCLDDVLQSLKGKKYEVIVRPHPQHVRHMRDKFIMMQEEYKGTNITIEIDFSTNNSILDADVLITDWSGIAYEYAFTTNKPVIYIDTPMKIMNPEYKAIDIEPFNIWVREQVGVVVKVKDVKKIDSVVEEMLKNHKKYEKKIAKLLHEYVYNVGTSAEVGAEYIIEAIQKKVEERRKKNDEE